MSTARKPNKPVYRVGDQVTFAYGPQRLVGTVVEDRGPIGLYGRRLHLVRTSLGDGESHAFEIPEVDLERLSDSSLDDPPGARLEYVVTYVRGDEPNHWIASTKLAGRYRGARVTGPIGYGTSPPDEPGQAEEKRATVSVFLKPGDDRETELALARRHADRMFKRRHPAAVVEHESDAELVPAD